MVLLNKVGGFMKKRVTKVGTLALLITVGAAIHLALISVQEEHTFKYVSVSVGDHPRQRLVDGASEQERSALDGRHLLHEKSKLNDAKYATLVEDGPNGPGTGNRKKVGHTIKLVGKPSTTKVSQLSQIPKSEHIFHNTTALRGTFKNVCMQNKFLIFFGWMPDQHWLWDTYTFLGVWVKMGTVRDWNSAIHVKGPSVTLIADTPGNNNIHHLWYGKHFPTITRVLQAKETGDNPPYFENIIQDGSIVNMGPIDFNLGSISLIIKLLQNFNAEHSYPKLSEYTANNTQIVCTETLSVQGTKVDLIRSAMGDVALAKKILHDYRALAFEKAAVKPPTSNRCPHKVLIFAKFDSNHKRWVNAKDFYNAFKTTHPTMDVEYWEVVDRTMTFEDQIRYFSNLDVFICPNGSHQQSAIFMAQGATVVEALDKDYDAPSWNIDYSLNYLLGLQSFQVRGRLATQAEYDAGIAHIDPQDIPKHQNMTWSFVVDVPAMVDSVTRHLHKIKKDCVKAHDSAH